MATDGEVKDVNLAESTIEWKGKKIIGPGKHHGTLGLKSGSLQFDGDALTGGSFVIDMTTLTNLDMAGKKGAGRLEGHLKSDDFFSVETYPEATLNITNVAASDNGYDITADLTIKGTTAPITFTAAVAANSATAEITVDRTIYKVKYGSGKFFDNLGDKAISDNFDLVVNLVY